MAKGKKKKRKKQAQAASASTTAGTGEQAVMDTSETKHAAHDSVVDDTTAADPGLESKKNGSPTNGRDDERDLEAQVEALIGQFEATEATAERAALLKQIGSLCREDDPDSSLEAYVAALWETPADVEVVNAIESMARELGRWQSVVERIWEDANASPDESAEVLKQLADWYENRLDSDEGARQCYALIIEHTPEDADARQAHLRLLEKMGDWQAVLDEIDGQLEDASRQRSNSLRVRAVEVAMFELGDDEAAQKRLDEMDSDDPQRRKLQSRLYERKNDFDGLLALLREDLERADTDTAKAELHAQIGVLQEEAFSDPDAARSSYQAALELNPAHEDARAGLQRVEAHFAGLGGDARLDYLRREIVTARAKQEWSRAISAQKELLSAQPGAEQEAALDDLLAEAGEFEELEQRAMAKFEEANSLLKKASLKHALAERMRKAKARGQEPDESRIWSLYEEAFALDPKHALRALRLADRAAEKNDNVAALRFYEAAVREGEQLSKNEAARASLKAADIAHDLGRKEKEQTLLVKALIYRGDDAELMLRLADLSYELGELDEAGEYYGGWLKSGHDPEIAGRARMRRAEALVGQGDGVGALVLLQKLPDALVGDHSAELRAKALEAAQRWGQAVDAWKEAAALTDDESKKCDWLLHAAQIAFSKNKDAAAAESLIRQADPDLKLRAARTQLMSVLARSEKWEALHELLNIQVEYAQSDRERAQFEKTAGFIAMEKLKNTELAEEHFERSLRAIADQGDVHTALESLRPPERIEQMAQTESERAAADDETYPDVPKAPPAPDLSEMGLEEATSTAEHVVLEAQKKLESERAQAEEAAEAERAQEPPEPEPTHELPPRGKTALSTSRFIDEDLWQEHVIHEEQDIFLTMLFAVVTPAVMADRKREFSEYGIDPSEARDPEQDPSPIAQTLHYVASLAQLPLPQLYTKPGSTGGLEFLHTIPPAMGVGSGADAGGPGQALAFVAARALSFYRPGHYLRELISSGSDLRAWLIGSIRLSRPTFAAPDELEGAVRAAQASLERNLPGSSKKVLAELCTKLLDHAPSLDLKRWVKAIDLTADRIGFIVADDLEMASALIQASPTHASVVSNHERVDALTTYAKSHRYYTLRQALDLDV